MRKNVYDKIKAGIDNEVFKVIRLVKCTSSGQDVIIGFSSLGKDQAYERLKYIRHKLENDLEPGEYEIQCKNGFTKGALQESFRITIEPKPTVQIIHNDEDKKEQEPKIHSDMERDVITIEEYTKLIRELESYKAKCALLMTEIELRNQFGNVTQQQQKGLSDNGMNSFGSSLMETIKEVAPSALQMLEKRLEQRDRELTLQENAMNNNLVKVRKNPPSQGQQIQTADDVANYLYDLYGKDQHAFNVELDKIEASNPQLYSYVCEKLGITEEEEEEEDNNE